MEKSAKELNAVLVGSESSRKYQVGNIILGKQAFDPGNLMSRCERQEGEVCGRTVTLVKSPGWLRGYTLCNTPELFKTEAILSVTLCPLALHGIILVINAELPFKAEYKKATEEHLQHFFGDKVWDHTIVVFSLRGKLGDKTIEDYITKEGAPLQWLLEACGNRYHVLCDDDTGNSEKVQELFEKIDGMVAENRCYEADSTRLQSFESKKKEVAKKAEELRRQSQLQRVKLRSLMTEPTLNLRILMVGWVFSGKSATGNNILSSEVFQSGDRTVNALKQSGEVSGREVVIVDTPGWWKFFPAMFSPPTLKPEILKGVSLCSPSPNVILLAVTLDTSFTDEQRRVTEGNMRLLGERVWRHVIVLFTFGDTLGDKIIEQHIEGEGEPLRWLIEKCGNRYHVLDNTIAAEDQVEELLRKMEEMVAGNSSFYLETDDLQPEEERIDESTENRDENTTKEITEQLSFKWDRSNWEKHHSLRGTDTRSISEPLTMCGNEQKSESSEGEQMERRHKGDQFLNYFGLKVASEGDAGSGFLNRWMELLKSELIRHEVAMEQAARRHFYKDEGSEPDRDQALEAIEKVTSWLETKHTASGNDTDSGKDSITSWESEGDILRGASGVERHPTEN